MSSKDTILGAIRNSLADLKTRPVVPPPPVVWPITNKNEDELAEQFQTSLEAVLGEFVPCRDMNEATEKIAALFCEIGVKNVGVMGNEISRKVANSLSGVEKHFAPSDPEDVKPELLEPWDAGIVSPELLLADTGSCFFAAPSAFDRLLCYIVPLCVCVATKKMLRENLPHAWTELQDRFGSADSIERKTEAQTTGEFLIMTGPSRTADIEKVLILGVHGPRRVLVFLVD